MFTNVITPSKVEIGFGFTDGETEVWYNYSESVQVSRRVILQTSKRERGDAVTLG